MTSNLRDLDQFEDTRASSRAGLDEWDMDLDDLFDEDGDLFMAVLLKSTANGLEFEVTWKLWAPNNFLDQQTYHNDLNDDFNTDVDDGSHMAAVNDDLFN